jgi:hypothetical protein|tara:strand:+ start:1039 stop:1995 length:957 start_codon:yes stop_codon:yes gene_type:complete
MTKIQFPVISGKTYNVQIAGRNDQKYTSAYSTVQNITIAGSTTPPSAPTSLTSSSDPLAITLFWNNAPNSDLKSVEIYYATSSGGSFNLLGSIDAVRSTNQEYNLVYDATTFSQNQTYYFKIRSVNYSNVASSYTSETSASFNTVNTNNVTQNAISNMFSSVQSGNAIISTVRDTINYNSTGNQLQGIMITTVTLGAIPSDIAGFSIVANAMCQKKSNWSPNKYVTAVVLQEVAGNNYWEQATGFGSSAQFLGDQEPDNRDFDDGVQATYSTSSIDTSGDVIGTTGSKYGLFLYTNSEPSYSLGVFAGTGLSITELKR